MTHQSHPPVGKQAGANGADADGASIPGELERLTAELERTKAVLAAQQAATAANEHRFSRMIDELPTGFFTVDRELRLTLVNVAAERMWHRDRRDLLGRPLADALPGITASNKYQAISAALRDDTPVVFEERSVIQSAWVAGRAYPIPGGVAVLVQDISDWRAAKLAVQESEQRYRNLFNSMDIGFCVLEVIFDSAGQPRDYRFLDVNPVFSNLTGLADPIGRRALELVPDLDPFWAATYGEVALTGEPIRFEQGDSAMGNRWFDVYACRIGAPEHRRVALLFTNISERKQLEQAQRDFVGMVSHDLGNPLAVVRGWAQIMRRRETYNAAGVTAIIEQTERMERLVSDLREFVQFESGLIELRLAIADLHELVRDAIGRARLQSPARPFAFTPSATPLFVQVDADRIGQVLDNLISNAMKYSPESAPITIAVDGKPVTAQVQVIDQGRGISPSELPRLFDRFYRGDDAGGVQGVGLGLYISRMLITAHSGQLTATSVLGEGSTFTLALPLATAPE